MTVIHTDNVSISDTASSLTSSKSATEWWWMQWTTGVRNGNWTLTAQKASQPDLPFQNRREIVPFNYTINSRCDIWQITVVTSRKLWANQKGRWAKLVQKQTPAGDGSNIWKKVWTAHVRSVLNYTAGGWHP